MRQVEVSRLDQFKDRYWGGGQGVWPSTGISIEKILVLNGLDSNPLVQSLGSDRIRICGGVSSYYRRDCRTEGVFSHWNNSVYLNKNESLEIE